LRATLFAMAPIVAPTPAEAPTATFDALPRFTPEDRGSTIERQRPEPGRYLVVQDGAEERPLRLEAEITHIGRGWAADVRLESQGVSRRHAIVVNRSSGARVLDDRSANGTFVNGRRVSDAALSDGDVIVVGGIVLTYREFA
jgi:pSer/pThr/pTyr-binding forkhead associated (FHA) protein